MNYFQICPLTKGKAVTPVTVKIMSKDYLTYARYHLLNAKTYYRTVGYSLEGLPERLEGKVYRNMRPVDFMDADPHFAGQLAVVSGRFRDVLLATNVDSLEYTLRPISLDGTEDEFYLLFTYMIPVSETVISESGFSVYDYDSGTARKASFESVADLLAGDLFHSQNVNVTDLVLPGKYAGRDLVSTQFHPYVSISEKLRNALEGAGITGMSTMQDFTIKFK